MKKIIQLSLFVFAFTFFNSNIIAQDAISIAEAREVDGEGSLIRLNQNVELTGIAIGPNFRGGGQTWVLYSIEDEIGITVFAFNNDVGYDVTDGDELRVVGELAEFNGLAEIIPTSINIISQGNSIPDPKVVTGLNESLEASLVTIQDVSLVDENQWMNSGSFNVDMTNGTITFQVRIDSDIEVSGMDAPQGTFDITGIVGQFDNEAPYSEGYQVFPRRASDIDPYDTGNTGGPVYEKLTIEQARETDNDLASTRLGELVEITGVAHGINFRPSGLQFTIINDNNVGIGLFSNDNLGYTFNEGDELTIWGRIAQFNGLTQINPDSIDVVSTNNFLQIASQKSTLDESTESSLTEITMTGWVDPNQWLADGSSFNVDFNTASGEVLTIRVDSDSPWSTQPIPDGFSIASGIGGQFDSSAPFDSGYQLLVYSNNAFAPYLSTEDLYTGNVKIYPNPTSGEFYIETDDLFEKVEIYNMNGQLVQTINGHSNHVSTNRLSAGVYMAKIHFDDGVHNQRITIE